MHVKNTILFVTIFLILFSGTSFASESDDSSAYFSQAVGLKLLNGRYWLGLNDNEHARLMYIRGIKDSAISIITKLPLDFRPQLIPQYTNSLSLKETDDLMNRFYEDTFNMKIPMIVAYTLIMAKSNGTTLEAYENQLANARKDWD